MLATHDLSQVIPPAEVDRFHIRLGLDPRGSRQAQDSAGISFDIVYRLVLRLVYGSDGREMVSRPLVVGVPQPPHLPDANEIRHQLREFTDAAEDFSRLSYWQRFNRAPTRWGGNYARWEPRKAVAQYLNLEETRMRKLLDVLEMEGVRDPALDRTEEAARELLGELPGIRQEFLQGAPD
jgi:hypothetical protein